MWKLTLSYHIIAMWWNPAKLCRKKAPKKGRENETRGKDRSPGKQTAQQRQGHSEEMEPLRAKPLQCPIGILKIWKWNFVKIWSWYVENHHNYHPLCSEQFHYSYHNIIIDDEKNNDFKI